MKKTGATILVTGATGYVGGRLVPRLLEAGYKVRCFVRNPTRLKHRPWEDQVQIAEGNVLDYPTTEKALQGIDTAYYLIHSLGAGEKEFAARDRQAASNFAKAAAAAGVKRIIYLGGLRPKSTKQSEHLMSRLETGDYLRKGPVPVIEFRAGVIVGSGSLSFELIRYLTERIPVLITPRWVQTPTHPIAIRDVLHYLMDALALKDEGHEIFEIGGKDVLTYAEMFMQYAEARGLKRFLVKLPVLTPRLSSHWISVVTPINTRIAKPLIKGLDNEVVVEDEKAKEVFKFVPLAYKEAVIKALERFEKDDVETFWSGALSSGIDYESMMEEVSEKEGMIREKLQLRVNAPPERVFDVVQSLGGDTGWLYANFLWQIRGYMDLLWGGVGLRKGRRSNTEIREGDTIDFWRVEQVEDNAFIRLRAEMKLPGKAWLQYRIKALGGGQSLVTQTAYFEPRGLMGLLYWYLLYVPHRFIFPGMFREIKARAEQAALQLKTKHSKTKQSKTNPSNHAELIQEATNEEVREAV